MITLLDIYQPHASVEAVSFLYQLLNERPSEANISHKGMPTPREHTAFVNRKPYRAWYLILQDEKALGWEMAGQPMRWVGAVYLTDRSEVGIGLLQECRKHDFARRAILELRKLHPGRLLANVAPGNAPSHALFERLGGKVIQHTYEIE